jgi:hypothetical protein
MPDAELLMKKRPQLRVEQLEARETPDVSLGRSAALTGPLPIQPLPQQQLSQPLALPDAPGIAQQDALTKALFHPHALESLFRDTQTLDDLLARSLQPHTIATSDAADTDSQQSDVSEFRALEDAAQGWNFFSNYTRKAIRNDELRYGRLRNRDELLNQVYVEWREHVGSNDVALAHLLDKTSAERQALRKAVRRVLDHERYDQRKQQKTVELYDQPAPDKPTEQEWTDLQIDWSTGVGNLGPRERQVLELRRQGMTFDEIGAATGMLKQRVFEIYNGALDRLQEIYRT